MSVSSAHTQNVCAQFAPNLPASYLEELQIALRATGECQLESEPCLETRIFDWMLMIESPESRWGDECEIHTKYEYTFYKGKQKLLDVHIRQGVPLSRSKAKKLGVFMIIQSLQSFHHLMHNIASKEMSQFDSIILIFHPCVDVKASLKIDPQDDGISSVSCVPDMLLQTFVHNTSILRQGDESAKKNTLQVIRSTNTSGSSHIIDFLRYLLKPRIRIFNSTKSKKKKRTEAQAYVSTEFTQEDAETVGFSQSKKQPSVKSSIFYTMLCAIPGIIPSRAHAIQTIFPTMYDLLDAYSRCKVDPKKYLSRVLSEKCSIDIGDFASESVYEALCCDMLQSSL